MQIAILPWLLFPVVALGAALLALLLWRSRRRLALAASVLALVSTLCILLEVWATSAKANIRIDLLLTLPLVAFGAFLAGVAALKGSRSLARLIASGLLIVGAVSGAWFAWTMTESSLEAGRLTKIFDQGKKLYWEETIRCEAALVKRFGPLQPTSHPCRGHFVVASRNTLSYPFTRAIVNDNGDVYLLFSPETGVEVIWSLGDRPVAHVRSESGDILSGDGSEGMEPIRITLRGLGAGCEAKVKRASAPESVLTLTKAELPRCTNSPNPPVRFVGAFGTVVALEGSSQMKHLVQIWLWETEGTARGLLLQSTGQSGTKTQFNFVKPLRGNAVSNNEWELAGFDLQLRPTSERVTVALIGEQARVAGSPIRFLPQGGTLLEKRELARHPKIALIPLQERARFELYFDNVLHNLDVPLTVP